MRPDDTAHSRDCAICAKHRGEGSLKGQLVGRYDGFWVYHGQPGADGLAAPGHLVIESDRHAPYLGDLTDSEAAALGRLAVTGGACAAGRARGAVRLHRRDR